MSELKPTQAHVEQALLTLRPDATWAPHYVLGVPVRRLDRPGAWYSVGTYEGDLLREGDGGELDLMDAAHAIRLGLGRYEPRFEQVVCGECAQTKPAWRARNCPECVVMVCVDCHNGHPDTHGEYYAQLAWAVDAMSPPSRVASRAQRKPVQLEIGL